MLDRVLERRLADGKKSVLLLGPRQVGKTTLCRALKPDVTIDLADEAEYLRYAKDPGRLRQESAAWPVRTLVLIDEIQRVPALLNLVQLIVDRPRNQTRFLLTGSSARKLRRRGVNLLPGRVVLEYLDPLLMSELGANFVLEKCLRLGMLPELQLMDTEANETLETYSEIYLREEIRAEALTQNVGAYARFLDVVAEMSGQWLNYSKLSADTEIPKETIRRYVSILEDTLLLFRLPAFQPSIKTTRRVLQRERVLLFDVGVRNALLGLHRRAASQQELGPLFEQWLILQVFYLDRAFRKRWKLSSYRTEGGAEVDLVIETADELLGVEIKASKNIRAADTRGLASLADLVAKAKPLRKIIACWVDRPLKIDDVSVVNYREFLTELEQLE
ncbi:MAG: ATP-binding protein [Planctomycetota bacterium]